MDTIFMNSKNSKTSEPHRLLLNPTDKINLNRSDKYIFLSNFNLYYTWKNIKKSYKNNKLKISSPMWNEIFELPAGSYSVSDIQNCFEYIIKNMKKWLIILQNKYVNKTENRVVTFKIKKSYYLKLFKPWNNGSIKNKRGEYVLHLESHCESTVMVSTMIINTLQDICSK